MSGFVTEPLRSDKHPHTSAKHGDQRPWYENSSDVIRANRTLNMDESNEPDPQMDISAGQKMLSAVSGSLLTSLLGMYLHALIGHRANTRCSSHPTGRCPSPPTITAQPLSCSSPYITIPTYPLYEPTSKSRRYRLLPRSLLGEQHLCLLGRQPLCHSQYIRNGNR